MSVAQECKIRESPRDRRGQLKGLKLRRASLGALEAGPGIEPGVPRSWRPSAGAAGKGAALPARRAPAPSPAFRGLVRRDPEGGRTGPEPRLPRDAPTRRRGKSSAPGKSPDAARRGRSRGRGEEGESAPGDEGGRCVCGARGRTRRPRERGGVHGRPRPGAPARPRPAARPGPSPPARPSLLPEVPAAGSPLPPAPSLRRAHLIPALIPYIPASSCRLRAGAGDGPQLPAPPPAPPRPPVPSPASRDSAEPRLESRRSLGADPWGVAWRTQPTLPHPGTGPTGAPPSGALEGKAGTITSNEWSSPNSPEGSSVSGGSQALDKPIDNDAEGVWSPDIEQSFQEALAIYPPCGRRKIILSDEGKMYGRNELIARYIKLRTGKTRTRKQVSSHIQVLARRKAREIQAKLKDQAAKDKALQSMAAMSSAQIISASAFHSKMALARGPGHPAVSGFWQGALSGQAGTSHDVKPFSQQTYTVQPALPLPGFESPAGPTPSPSAPPAPPWQGRSVASSKLWMLEFSAFLEQQQDPDTYNKHLFVHIGQSSPSYSDPYLEAVDIRQIYDKFPEKKGGLKELFERGPSNAFFLVKFWADLNTNIEDEGTSFYGVSSQYESPENMIITCSTKVCSFGKQVVEKVETEYARYENGHYSYRIHRSPLCEYMINFIHKLKHLPEKYMMNSVLENFTILQVVTNRDTQETLLCIAYVFEVSASEHGAQHHIYRLVKE
ncbi:transcriptional enhancer factor TEF-3 [Cynocephalus volans]|uniref:transcriptional enhancer factor TEF-3 n=1 Tax=Cynocephalus volans TaxID=110931 RepID=UPI002FC9C6A3